MAQIHAYHPAKKQVAAIFKYPLESRWCDSPCLPILMSLKPPGRIIPHPSLLTLICLGFGISLQTGQITGERTGSESKLAFYVSLILLAQWTDQRERMSVWPWLWYGCGEPGPTRTAIVSATGASENAEAKSCTGEQAMVCPPHTHTLPDCGSDSCGHCAQGFHQILGKKELGEYLSDFQEVKVA